ncbi:hypothetical protein C8035_v002123 [Colletotrichum spinosum]|uniref:Uncharacterized protein n=1 Tax=Colletotrichum spinosum TaxID=1347390 RepID=A0A4R8QXU0_9PEZI|nr:hypothetical protein C8035_v002123 [Colletotrichum spinosum]
MFQGWAAHRSEPGGGRPRPGPGTGREGDLSSRFSPWDQDKPAILGFSPPVTLCACARVLLHAALPLSLPQPGTMVRCGWQAGVGNKSDSSTSPTYSNASVPRRATPTRKDSYVTQGDPFGYGQCWFQDVGRHQRLLSLIDGAAMMQVSRRRRWPLLCSRPVGAYRGLAFFPSFFPSEAGSETAKR